MESWRQMYGSLLQLPNVSSIFFSDSMGIIALHVYGHLSLSAEAFCAIIIFSCVVLSQYPISRCDTHCDTWDMMRYVSRYLGHDAIYVWRYLYPDCSAARGNHVEIMVNTITVILDIRDTCKINSTSTNTVPRTVPGNVRSH